MLHCNGEAALLEMNGRSIELSSEMESSAGIQFGVKVCCSSDGQDQTAIYYDRAEKKLKIDTTKASLGQGPKMVDERAA